MQRKVLISLVATGCSLTASGALAMVVAAGGGATTSAAAPDAVEVAPEPSVVIERVFDDTFVVLGSKPVEAARSGRPSTTSAVSGPAPEAGSDAVTAPPGAPKATDAPRAGAPSATGTPTTTVRATSTTTRPPATTTTTAAPAAPVATTTTAAAQSASYTSTGGSFTLRWTATSMQVTSTTPKPGYSARVEGGGTEIHVLFASSSRDVEIEITLVGGSPRVKGL